jgi:hypothetical protein
MTLPPDPYALKAVETATKTILELLHEDVKVGIHLLLNTIKERGKEKAIRNANAFGSILESEMHQRISIGISPDGYERIEGNLDDPDFAYIVRQATIASARTSSPDKHKLLARAVMERLLAKPESIVALASSLACEVIPCLTPSHLTFLGLLTTISTIRPDHDQGTINAHLDYQQKEYISWIEYTFSAFKPFPQLRSVDFAHMQAMSCIDFLHIGASDFTKILLPRDLPNFTWPEGFFDNNELMVELKKIDGLLYCTATTVGALIGTHVHDIRTNKPPTIVSWDKT